MASRQPSLLARALEPFASGLWTLFILWTALVAVVWIADFGEANLYEYIANPGLRSALEFFLDSLDVAWVTLAAANCYLALTEVEGLAVARRWALLVIVGVWTVAALSRLFEIPLGPIHYTARLGTRIGPVPFGLPLLWFAFIVGARSLVIRCAPRASHARAACGAGVLATLAGAILEPLAWIERAFWFWHPSHMDIEAIVPPPVQNYATWLAISWGFAFAMRETRIADASAGSFPRPALVFLILNAVFLATHVARFIQH